MKRLVVPKITSVVAVADKGSSGIIDCVNWPSAYPYKPIVTFRLGHTGTSLCILFIVEEQNVKAICTENNGPVWEDSCVEFFVQTPNDAHYFNFEINCIGTGLAARRLSKTEDIEYFSTEQMNRIVRRSSLPHKPIDIRNNQWTMLLGIPFDLIGCDGCPNHLLANFYKCGDKTAVPHFISWNAIDTPEPNFHKPEYFGYLLFEK